VEQEPVVGIGGFAFRGVPEQVLLYLIGGVAGAGHESEAMADTIDMGIDGHGVHAEGDCLHDVGGLSAYAWQTEQGVHIAGHFTTIVCGEYLRELYEVLGFGVRVGDALDVFIDFGLVGCCHRLGIGVCLEEGWCDEVDSLVGALGGEHYGDEQLKDGAKLQLGIDYGLLLAEVGENTVVKFSSFHF
jgi:hypothetical protein